MADGALYPEDYRCRCCARRVFGSDAASVLRALVTLAGETPEAWALARRADVEVKCRACGTFQRVPLLG